jgi:hypothetical protein
MNRALACPNTNYEYQIFKPFIICVLENPAGDGEPYSRLEMGENTVLCWVKRR